MKKWRHVDSGIQRNMVAAAFLLPHMAGVLCFALLPMIQVLVRSFQSAVGGNWVGLKNYLTVWNNTAFRLAICNTAKFILVCVPILVGVSLVLTVGVQSLPGVGKRIRSVFLMPMSIPAASVVLVWKALFHDNGLINHALLDMGAGTIHWMDSGAAFWMLVISYLWKNLGYTMVLWAAGLAAIPKSCYEAAQLDGATSWQIFFQITLPNLKGSAYILVVLSVLNSFKVFREAWLVAGDYPDQSMYLLQHLYNNWFRELDFDKIAAAGVMCSVVIFLLIGMLRQAWDEKGEV